MVMLQTGSGLPCKPHMKNTKALLIFCTLLMLLTTICSSANVHAEQLSVRVIYLVSSDRIENSATKIKIETAVLSVQAWYKRQLNGFTFRLNSPVVEVAKVPYPSNYYSTNPQKEDKSSWGSRNCAEVAKETVGAKHFDSNFTWLVVVDGGRFVSHGGSGFACMADDPFFDSNRNDYSREDAFMGIVAHELGHSFGLQHPVEKKDSDRSLMAFGSMVYPNETFLLESDKVVLERSPFLFKTDVPIRGDVVDRYDYSGGYLEKRNGPYWYFIMKNASLFKTLIEIEGDLKYKTLMEVGGKIFLRLPIDGGVTQVSANQKQTWQNSFVVEHKK